MSVRTAHADSEESMGLGRLIVRLIVGGLFIGHGTQKLFGWFGGPGPTGTEQMMAALQLHPPRRNALAAGAAETGGGVLLAAGLATPLAAASLIGPWVTNGGYEYNLVLIAALLGLVDGGPGELSLDRALGIHDTGPRWALGALALGAAASALTVQLGRHAATKTGAVGQETPGPSTAGDPVTAD
jgi:putative oxidoreductase